MAETAIELGVPTKFVSSPTLQRATWSAQVIRADLIVANNVLAHVPDLNDFVRGLHDFASTTRRNYPRIPHLMRLMQENQFDTIYHEHFSYFSLIAAQQVLARHGLKDFRCRRTAHPWRIIATLRLSSSRSTKSSRYTVSRSYNAGEGRPAFLNLQHYLSFESKLKTPRENSWIFSWRRKRTKKTIVGYGAPAKGNTLLNYCGICTDLIDYTVDRSPAQARTPAAWDTDSHLHPDHIRANNQTTY